MSTGYYSSFYNDESHSDKRYQFTIVIQRPNHPPATQHTLDPGKPRSGRLLWVNPEDLFVKDQRNRQLPIGERNFHGSAYDWQNGYITAKVIFSGENGATWQKRQIPSSKSLYDTLYLLVDTPEHWTNVLELPAWITTPSSHESGPPARLNPFRPYPEPEADLFPFEDELEPEPEDRRRIPSEELFISDSDSDNE